MKKKLYFLPLLAALVMAGCTKEDSENGGGNNDGNGEQYLAISIVSNTSGTRASKPDGFEDGTEAENTVKAVRLYFFSSTGDPLNIKKGAGGNYYDVPEIAFKDETQKDNVEKVINAFIMIDAGELLPKQVVAVINPPTDLTDANDPTNKKLALSDLRKKVHDYASLAKDKTSPSFVMANSVYHNNQKIFYATTIEKDHYEKSEEEAKGNPVVIYVERNVAKVRVGVSDDMPKKGNLFMVYQKEKDENDQYTGKEFPYTIGEGANKKQVYVKFEGWDVTADLQYAWLVKDILPSGWAQNHLGVGTFWNDPDNHRSYWAKDCNGGINKDNKNQYYPYNKATRFTNTKFDGKECTYCNENADKGTPVKFQPTVVLVKGTLCDEAGNPLTITEYASFRTVDDANFSTLKRRYVAMMVNNTAAISSIPYKKVVDKDGKTVYKQLEAADLTFTPVNQVVENDVQVDNAAKAVEASGRCYVHACLTSEAENYEWYSSIQEDASGNATVKPEDKVKDPKTEINTYLKSLSHAKIWKSGQTYYYANIEHYNKSGVVRNHIYDVKLKKVYGIGTPVYDETLDIIPEHPSSEDTYVAAKIDILSWHLMTQDVEFDWN